FRFGIHNHLAESRQFFKDQFLIADPQIYKAKTFGLIKLVAESGKHFRSSAKAVCGFEVNSRVVFAIAVKIARSREVISTQQGKTSDLDSEGRFKRVTAIVIKIFDSRAGEVIIGDGQRYRAKSQG